ncbi:MAG: hypothetical protein IPL62_12810 [Caulobacteraceae bacterium]|nr:hypothetical protein [Caulobacteraceae bacterium]
MQYFINHAALERVAAEVFSGARARYYLYGMIALAVTSVAGAALATIWLGLALLVDTTRNTLSKQFKQLSATQAAAAALALDVATAASLAVAPAIAWYSGAAMGGAICATLLVAPHSITAERQSRCVRRGYHGRRVDLICVCPRSSSNQQRRSCAHAGRRVGAPAQYELR